MVVLCHDPVNVTTTIATRYHVVLSILVLHVALFGQRSIITLPKWFCSCVTCRMLNSPAADMQAMAGSAYKDSALGDSVKVLNPIEELITSFGTGQPMVFQVRCHVYHLSIQFSDQAKVRDAERPTCAAGDTDSALCYYCHRNRSQRCA